MRFTSDQTRCLAAIAANGSARGFAWATVESLRRRRLIEPASPARPHPSGGRAAYWRLTEAGSALYVTLKAGECPLCSRLGIAFTVDLSSRHRILRRHLTPIGDWCNDGARVDAGFTGVIM